MIGAKGKYTRIDQGSPRAIARCDYSGLICMNEDLVKQMQYTGQGLVWTGLWVNKVFADQPNPQQMAPLIMPDPMPVANPNPDSNQGIITLSDTIRDTLGVAYSSAGGTAAYAFDGDPLTACTQTSPNGYISFNFERPTGVQWIGITSFFGDHNYQIALDMSYNNVQWINILQWPLATYPSGETIWNSLNGYCTAPVWRIRETQGATLNIQELYFNVPKDNIHE